MVSRRDVVTGGIFASVSAAALAAPAEAGQGNDTQALQSGLSGIQRSLSEIEKVLDDGLRQPGLAAGHVGRLRGAYDQFLRANGRFPQLCEIGTAVFYDIYDWHVKHSQQIQITRLPDNRLAIQFMFTQLILRWENDPAYIGIPFDRG